MLAAEANAADLIRRIRSVRAPVGMSEAESRLYEVLSAECCAGALLALEALYISCHGLTDLRDVCLPTALGYLGLLTIDSSLDPASLKHDRIMWLGLMTKGVHLPRGGETLTGLPRLEYLCLYRVDVSAWLETGPFPPPTVRSWNWRTAPCPTTRPRSTSPACTSSSCDHSTTAPPSRRRTRP
uniref:hypothetical protein n=1 Tax=Streptomyces sp. DG1A-41 TaxID=3125779 RepID=UPI00403FCDC6